MPKATRCKLNGRVIDVEEAAALRDRKPSIVFDCIRCGERVQPHNRGTTGQAAHFEHRKANPDCQLSSGR